MIFKSDLLDTIVSYSHRFQGLYRNQYFQGVMILGGMDEIQIQMDDQLVKCQALRASPYLDFFAGSFKVRYFNR